MVNLWFARKGEIFEEAEGPSFYDSLQEDWYSELEREKASISVESIKLINELHNFIPYFEDDLQQPSNSWKTLGLLRWGIADKDKLDFVPKLKSYLQNHPEIVGCFISKIEPNAKIIEHSGTTNANYRCHLGLIVPSEDPNLLGIHVKSETLSWSEQKLLTFIDANKHYAWNKTEQERYVLIFDVIRPAFLSKKDFILSRILVMMTFAIFANKSNMKFLYSTPNFALNLLAHLLIPASKILLSLKRV
jgi:aspartyl/asparaginyl beta-hydroxylase (cupin superfamily)